MIPSEMKKAGVSAGLFGDYSVRRARTIAPRYSSEATFSQQ